MRAEGQERREVREMREEGQRNRRASRIPSASSSSSCNFLKEKRGGERGEVLASRGERLVPFVFFIIIWGGGRDGDVGLWVYTGESSQVGYCCMISPKPKPDRVVSLQTS